MLETHVKQINEELQYEIGGGIILNFFPIKKRFNRIYIFGGNYDRDSGGAVHMIINQALKKCIEEKNIKIRNHIGNYQNWWLILVNDIIADLENADWKNIRLFPPIKSNFQKVLIISKGIPFDDYEYI